MGGLGVGSGRGSAKVHICLSLPHPHVFFLFSHIGLSSVDRRPGLLLPTSHWPLCPRLSAFRHAPAWSSRPAPQSVWVTSLTFQCLPLPSEYWHQLHCLHSPHAPPELLSPVSQAQYHTFATKPSRFTSFTWWTHTLPLRQVTGSLLWVMSPQCSKGELYGASPKPPQDFFLSPL